MFRDSSQFSPAPRQVELDPALGAAAAIRNPGRPVSSRQTSAGNAVSAFTIFNLTLLEQTLGKHLDLSAGVHNIIDKNYFDPGGPEDVQDAIQQNGRSFRCKITGRF